jgi:hypothetical protein
MPERRDGICGLENDWTSATNAQGGAYPNTMERLAASFVGRFYAGIGGFVLDLLRKPGNELYWTCVWPNNAHPKA